MRFKSLTVPLLLATMVLASGCAPPPPWLRDIDAGGKFGCYTDTLIDGLKCWGSNSAGQARPPALAYPTDIATGLDFACALDGGKLYCWGNKPSGSLSLSNPKKLAAGNSHVCVLDKKTVKCLGDAAQTNVPTLNNPTQISADGDRTCVIDGNTVQCWGDNTDSITLSNPTQLAAGANHVCALSAGAVHCTGSETDVVDSIPDVTNAYKLASSNGYSCVIDINGTQCWGVPALTAVYDVVDMTNPTQIVAGGDGTSAHACVRHLQGLKCWGDDASKQLNPYRGSNYHRIIPGVAEIEATPEEVWAVLMDLDSYGLWNPFTTKMTSTLNIGAPMIMEVQFATGPLEQIETIRVLKPNYKVCWGIDDGDREAVTGERCQWLEELDNGNTLYTTNDLIEGTLAPITFDLFNADLHAGFQGVADGLKEYVESLESP